MIIGIKELTLGENKTSHSDDEDQDDEQAQPSNEAVEKMEEFGEDGNWDSPDPHIDILGRSHSLHKGRIRGSGVEEPAPETAIQPSWIYYRRQKYAFYFNHIKRTPYSLRPIQPRPN